MRHTDRRLCDKICRIVRNKNARLIIIFRVVGWLLTLLLGVSLLSACGTAPATPVIIATPEPAVAFTPLDQFTRSKYSQQPLPIRTAGYVYLDANGARLVDLLSFAEGSTPTPLSPMEQQLWLGSNPSPALEALLRPAGEAHIAAVVARGQLDGPGHFGPSGAYRFQLSAPTFEPLVPQDTTIHDLEERQEAYAFRLVRVVGTLYLADTAALLVEGVSEQGVPLPDARLVKIGVPLDDPALVNSLQSAQDPNVHYGRVQLEAFWRSGMLYPLAIFPAN